MLVTAGVNLTIGATGDAENVITLGGEVYLRFAFRRHLVNAALWSSAGVEVFALRIEGERPDVGTQAITEGLHLAPRINFQDTAMRASAGVDAAAGSDDQTENLA